MFLVAKMIGKKQIYYNCEKWLYTNWKTVSGLNSHFVLIGHWLEKKGMFLSVGIKRGSMESLDSTVLE